MFQVYVEGNDLAYEEATATLETNGRSIPSRPLVHNYLAIATRWVSKRPSARLDFVFDEPCDFTITYRLKLSGILARGKALRSRLWTSSLLPERFQLASTDRLPPDAFGCFTLRHVSTSTSKPPPWSLSAPRRSGI